jgi:hypothetical protein
MQSITHNEYVGQYLLSKNSAKSDTVARLETDQLAINIKKREAEKGNGRYFLFQEKPYRKYISNLYPTATVAMSYNYAGADLTDKDDWYFDTRTQNEITKYRLNLYKDKAVIEITGKRSA